MRACRDNLSKPSWRSQRTLSPARGRGLGLRGRRGLLRLFFILLSMAWGWVLPHPLLAKSLSFGYNNASLRRMHWIGKARRLLARKPERVMPVLVWASAALCVAGPARAPAATAPCWGRPRPVSVSPTSSPQSASASAKPADLQTTRDTRAGRRPRLDHGRPPLPDTKPAALLAALTSQPTDLLIVDPADLVAAVADQLVARLKTRRTPPAERAAARVGRAGHRQN